MKPRFYLDAARRTKPSQALMRMRRLVPPPVIALRTKPATTPDWRPIADGLGSDSAPQSGPTPAPDETQIFSAAGVTRRFGSPRFWTDRSDGLLFLFHLHGFSPLGTYAAGERSQEGDAFWARVVEDWLASEMKPRLPAWHPYPTSIRLVAWCAALSSLDWPLGLRERVASEVFRQAGYLRRSIEYDIGGNHVLKNAVALVFAGAVVPSSGVFDSGLRLLQRELGRQLLHDGGHEERSTSYHRAIADDLGKLEELIERTRRRAPDWLITARARAGAWRAALAGPDRHLPLLNDAWEGPTERSRADEPLTALHNTGYVVFRHGGDQAVFDAGPMSPPHLPPHAHADVLSFVFWADGRPLIVDPGSYSYTGPWRNHFRRTAAHNTVEVDGANQCELWTDFRVVFPPRVRLGTPLIDRSYAVATACHDGYRRLPDSVEHHRAFVWLPRTGVVVVDRLRALQSHAVRTRLHLAPGVRWDGTSGVAGFDVVALGGGEVHQVDGMYSPFLGCKVSIDVLEDERTIQPDTPFGWSVLRKGARVTRLELDRLEVSRDGDSQLIVPLAWC